jgi:hypothetical protein
MGLPLAQLAVLVAGNSLCLSVRLLVYYTMQRMDIILESGELFTAVQGH